ncbi:MAG: transcriptional regulator NrdR [Alphaproteobacteria bacterium]|jgi:transcriptional repressor NrdR
MKCPFCGYDDTQVRDSRPSEDGISIRRRRHCTSCDARFTTYERVQLKELNVVKKDGSKDVFDREKIAQSLIIATRKRNVQEEELEKTVNNIVRELEQEAVSGEVPTKLIGEKVMKYLLAIDKVAYIRFASVYKDFATPQDFQDFIRAIDSN